jgi:hypothetical protein
MLPCLHGLLEDIKASDRRPAGSGRHVARENLHRGALPSAVWPQEANDFAFLHLEVEVLDRGEASVSFR